MFEHASLEPSLLRIVLWLQWITSQTSQMVYPYIRHYGGVMFLDDFLYNPQQYLHVLVGFQSHLLQKDS